MRSLTRRRWDGCSAPLGARSSGLTLLEVVIAFSLVTLAILALLAIFTSGLRLMRQSTNLTMATDVGREFLESVKHDGYSALTVGRFDGRIPDSPNSFSLFPQAPYPHTQRGNQGYFLVVEVTQATDHSRLVKVQVVWDEQSRAELATMVYK